MNRTITFLVDKQVKKYFVPKWIRYPRNKFTLYGGDNSVPNSHSYFFLEFADILGVEYKVKDYNDEIKRVVSEYLVNQDFHTIEAVMGKKRWHTPILYLITAVAKPFIQEQFNQVMLPREK